MSIYSEIQKLINYGIAEKLIYPEDEVYVRNKILASLDIQDWENVQGEVETPTSPNTVLEQILDWAYETGRLEHNTVTERDLLDAVIMDCLMPRPSELIREFNTLFQQSPELATERYYQVSKASNYIRMDRIDKNKQWTFQSQYGVLDITINLSKPEKDPKEIARMKELPPSNYPLCLLCPENEGYLGTLSHPARSNHRIIPLRLAEEDWFLQYSPYVYYSEHSIIFHKEHVPMKLTAKTFNRLLDFVDQFPHYFIGSNADLPIVGGSILSHDHFQGGRYTFAIEKAEMEEVFHLSEFPSVTIGIVEWPMSVIRIRGTKEEVGKVTEMIWRKWLSYSDPEVHILANTDNTPHNTITPIARKRGDLFEMDIVLRNNRTNEQYPDGIFHPHQDLHHIKKENIGLIEVMGLAVLPGRLELELSLLADYIVQSKQKEDWASEMLKHYDWAEQIKSKYSSIQEEQVMEILQQEVGYKFEKVLEDAGVFKRTAEGKTAFLAFMKQIKDT